jgi:hypothetical protein
MKKPSVSNYVPNYKRLNITPKEMPSSNDSQFVVSRGSKQNPRERVAPQTRAIPFAEVVIEDKFPIGNGPIPNSGNNVEYTWAGVDGSFVDDVGLIEESSNQIIDNNDYIEIDEPSYTQKKNETDLNQELDEDKKLESREIKEYTLLLFGDFYSSGSLIEIQKEVTDILYGQHELCSHTSITLDDIIVLKKMNIKFGVFIGEN